MDMHWLASGVVLLILAVLSAYLDALRNEPISRFDPGYDGASYAEEFE
jgi:hypothetical protein